MSKVLIFSDFHLHNWLYGATFNDKWNSRLLDQRNVADQIIQLADQHKVDYVVFCGDLFHVHGKVESGPLSIASNLFYSLSKIAKHVYVLIGNHDMGRDSTSIDWLKCMSENITVVEDSTVDMDEKFGFISYNDDPVKFKRCISHLNLYDLDYWFLHQGVQDVPVGSDFVIPNEIFNSNMISHKVKIAFTGHYHNHRKVKDNLVIIGPPMQHTWSDEGQDRGCVILDTWTGNWDHIKLRSPKFIKYFDNDEDVRNNFIKVEVEVTHPNALREYLMSQGARSVEFSYKKEAPVIDTSSNDINFDLNSVMEKFIKINKVDKLGMKINVEIIENSYETPETNS